MLSVLDLSKKIWWDFQKLASDSGSNNQNNKIFFFFFFYYIFLFCLSSDLPLPRFADLKTEPEMRYTSVPPCVDGQVSQGGAAPGSDSWTPSDKSAFGHPESNTTKVNLKFIYVVSSLLDNLYICMVANCYTVSKAKTVKVWKSNNQHFSHCSFKKLVRV